MAPGRRLRPKPGCSSERLGPPSREQARCQPDEARANVYAVGLLMYTLLVGHGPFAHVEDALALLQAHVQQAPAPPLRQAAQWIPGALGGAVLKALAKRAEDRLQSAEVFTEALGRSAAGLARVEGGVQGPEAAGAAPGRARVGRRDEAPSGWQVARWGEVEGGWKPEIRAWFEPVRGGDDGAGRGAGTGAARVDAVVEVDARLFAGLTVASAVMFSLIAALVLRGLGVW